MPRRSQFRLLVALLVSTAAAFAQSQNASLGGQVLDGSGAFVTGPRLPSVPRNAGFRRSKATAMAAIRFQT
jgi:hypothetical protein